MIQIDDITKRSRYINSSNKDQEYNRFHNKTKTLLESKKYIFEDKKFILQHWQSINENQIECFKSVIDILDESFDNDNKRDFEYIKSYIINEITPTVRDAKQTARYIKYKTTRMKNRIGENIKKNTAEIVDRTKAAANNIKDTSSKSISVLKNNAKKSLGKNIKEEELREAYVQILDTLDKYNHCDRIIENAYTVQKRFNIMNMVTSTDTNNKYKLNALIDSICECVNTYDADFKTRFNTTLETCFYFLSRENKNFDKSLVLEEVVNNFISGDLPEYKLMEMKSIIDESIIFDQLDKECIKSIYTEEPFIESAELAKPFLKSTNNYISDLGTAISNISEEMNDKDVRKIFSSIRPLFTVTGGEILATCIKDIEFLLKNIKSQYTGDNFSKLCADELERVKKKRDNRSMEGYLAQASYIKLLEKYSSNYSKNESVLIMDFLPFEESFRDTASKTAKDIVNSFKLAKTKRSTDIRTCVSRMFTKSPNQIIDGTPNFLSWLRLTYVIGATALNPVLGGVTLLVDQFIAMKLKRRDVSKMITAFKNERKNIAEKLNKVDDNEKKNLKEYDKYLKNGIEKLEEYQESLLSDFEKRSLDTGEEYDKNKELKSVIGLDDDEFEDFELEATSFEKLFENSNYFSKEYFTKNIRECINYMNEDTIDIITNIACKYPNIISNSGLYSILQEELDTLNNNYNGAKRLIRLSCIKSNMKKLDPSSEEYIVTSDDTTDVFEVINGLDDLFTEITINKSLNIANESVSSTMKTLGNKLRKTMQKASDIDKEATRRIDSSVNLFVSSMQRAARNNNREAIIRGSIIPSASKVIKAAIIDGGVALINPALAIILALGQFAVSKKMQKKERQLVLDELEVEIEMCKRYLRQAEDQNDLEAQKRLLRIQRNLERQKQRIAYNMKMYWNQDVPSINKNED